MLVADSRRSDRERVEATPAQVLDERLHVAREVYDIVAHSLGVIAVQAGVGAHLMDKDPEEARAALTNSVRHGRAAAAAVNLERDRCGIRLSVRDHGSSAGVHTVGSRLER